MNKNNKISRKKGDKKQVYCLDCLLGSPIKITRADFLVLVHGNACDIVKGEEIKDKRVVGVCNDCLRNKNEYQKERVFVVDTNNPNLIGCTV